MARPPNEPRVDRDRPPAPDFAFVFVFACGLFAAGQAACGVPALSENADAAVADAGPMAAGADLAMPAVAPACAAQMYFNDKAWPKVFSVCAGCHVPGGASGGTRFVLKPPAAAGALAANFGVVAQAATALSLGDESLLVLKPTAQVPHGGGTVLAMDPTAVPILVEMVRQLRDPATVAACAGAVPSTLDGVTLADARATLRKAALQIAGRAPTDAEYAAADAGDPRTLAALDPIVLAMMGEDAFYDRLKEMWNDLLLTDKNRFEGGYNFLAANGVPPSLRAAKACDATNWFNYDERTRTAQSRLCINATDALAREPLELIAHVVREDRSFGEILTARYRYMNVFMAQLFGLDTTPFAGHTDDARYFAEMKFPAMHGPGGVPEEYAGLLTTNSFLFRYNSTGSNRNRGRSHYFYKFFLDRDVMKSAVRLDLSTIDFTKSPWKHDPQCTGCHGAIDPVAGAFQHWTNCYDIASVEYFSTRYCGNGDWYPETDMYAPGIGPGDANRLSPQQLPTALSVLADSATHDAGFARAVAAHVFGNLTGHPRLSPPADPNAADYSALDAAYTAQSTTLDKLARDFTASGLDFKRLVIAVIKTSAFRAANADKEGRVELTGLGGGSTTPPEVMHRKLGALVGGTWSLRGSASDPAPGLKDPPDYYLSLSKFRVFAGGMDSNNVRSRARAPSSLSAAVTARMALEVSCQYTAYDFALDKNQRRLFPRVDRTLVPSGDPAAPDQKPILDNLKWLHQSLLGEPLPDGDPELLATYQLLSDLHKQGVAAIAGGAVGVALIDPCSASSHYATGVALPVNSRYSDDANYVVRAWQGLIAYLLMDYRFVFEP